MNANNTSPNNPENGALLADLVEDKQFAAEMKVCERTIQRWDRLGCGPAFIRIGRRKYRRRAAIHAWLKSKEQCGGEA